MKEASEFVCKNAMPGVGCDLNEMTVLGVLFICTGVLCIYFLSQYLKTERGKPYYLDYTLIFWVTMFVWMEYRGLLCIYPFEYTHDLLRIFVIGLNYLLYLIPISLLVLILCELMFSYRNPGTRTIRIIRWTFIVFLLSFLLIGLALSFVELDDADPSTPLLLWHACTDFIVFVFVLIPSGLLIKVVTRQVVMPEDTCCVSGSIAVVTTFLVLILCRFSYNFTHFLNINIIANWYNNQLAKPGRLPLANVRVFSFFFYFIFDLGTALLAMIGVKTLQHHDLFFNYADPFYTNASDHQKPDSFRSNTSKGV